MRAVVHALDGVKFTLLALALVGLVGVAILAVPQQAERVALPGVGAAVAATPVLSTPTVADDPLVYPAGAGAWRPLLVESFNGNTLDTSRWSTCFWWSANAPLGCDGSSANGELQRYLPQNVSVHDGALDIVARHEHVATDTRSYDYTAGLITTEAKFSFRYGYVEARIRVTQGKGVWPAVWLLPADHSSTNEIDVAEILGDSPIVLNTALHYEVNGVPRSVGGVYRGGNFASGYHTVAVDWEPNTMTWYEDGKVAYRVTDPALIPHKDMYLLLNSAVGGYWSGNPDQTTLFPNHFQVDWVQVWTNAPLSR